MSVGYTTGRTDIDRTAGEASRSIEQWSGNVLQFKQYLDATPDEDLEALGYTPDDVALLKSSFNDLALLANIYKGQAEITPARDLGVFSRRMAGLIL